MPALKECPPCPSDGRTHGTYSTYTNGKCRGAECAAANREYGRADKARRRLDPEYRLAAKARRQANPESSRRATRNYLDRNPGHVQKWRAANPEKARAQVLLRRARLANADHGCVTSQFVAALYAMPCAYCGAPTEHIDHAYPLSQGGLHCVENLQPACSHCNTTKGARIPEDLPAAIVKCDVVTHG